jgi:aconitate hydratase
MTTETTCLSSIWQTDDEIKDFYEIHKRPDDYKELKPEGVAYYDGVVEVDLSKVKPMIALPFHPSNAYTIEELNANLDDILAECEERAKVSFGDKVEFNLRNKIKNGKLLVDQGIIAGCAGGGFENICAAADILDGASIGSDEFNLSVYPASVPVYMELIRNGAATKILSTGAILKTAFCGPCFGAGDTPANGELSIRHSTRNFPNREGSKIQSGQIASVALMDARSIAATAANKGILTPATEVPEKIGKYKYSFDKTIYDRRVFDSHGVADETVEVSAEPAANANAAANIIQAASGGTIKINPYLIRETTEEKVIINKDTFKIGKANRGVDYKIQGNGAISRVHAIIMLKDNAYYIKDNKSTNHTYVNHVPIEDDQEVLLSNNCTITLGDEDFIFKLR